MQDVDLLPPRLRAMNLSDKEIALPLPAVMDAIDALEASEVLLLGWEPMPTYSRNGQGAYPVPASRGMAGIAVPDSEHAWSKAVRESAEIHRASLGAHDDHSMIVCLVPLARSSSLLGAIAGAERLSA